MARALSAVDRLATVRIEHVHLPSVAAGAARVVRIELRRRARRG
jgi:hypothetical protein